MEHLDGPPQRRRPTWSWASDRLLRWILAVVILGTVLLVVDLISGQSVFGVIVGAAVNGWVITTAAAELRRRRRHDDQHRPPLGTGRYFEMTTEIEIDRPRSEVAAFASDPDNTVAWLRRTKSVEWQTPRPIAVGSRVAYVGQFLGRRLEQVYEVAAIVPGERLVMKLHGGRDLIEMIYTWRDSPAGGTVMTLRERAELSWPMRINLSLIRPVIRRVSRRSLERLKAVLED